MNRSEALRVLNEEITGCRKCARLVKYREKVAQEKRRAYRDCEYWGKPVPGFGDPRAELFLLGLAAAHSGDRLKLKNAFITAACRCAPPGNKPLPAELQNCRGYLERELALIRPRVVLALGKIAWDAYLGILKDGNIIPSRAPYIFAHGAIVKLPGQPVLLGVYHPSQQNTQTGKLTPAMYAEVFKRIQQILQDG